MFAQVSCQKGTMVPTCDQITKQTTNKEVTTVEKASGPLLPTQAVSGILIFVQTCFGYVMCRKYIGQTQAHTFGNSWKLPKTPGNVTNNLHTAGNIWKTCKTANTWKHMETPGNNTEHLRTTYIGNTCNVNNIMSEHCPMTNPMNP